MDKLKNIHKKSIYNRSDIKKSTECGCFYCIGVFSPDDISEWTDRGETALCPLCGIDSVIGDYSHNINRDFLLDMHKLWFEIQRK